MNTIADIVLIISLLLLISGLINPSAFVADKKTGKTLTRKDISIFFGITIVICLTVLYFNAPQATTSSHTQAANAAKTSATASTTDNTAKPATQAVTKPTLRQDLAFQGDASFCDATYRANDDGTTTWTLNIKQAGELITHLSDKSGHIYRHDDKVNVGYTAYTANVNINDVSEINGVLYIGNDNHPCNIAPAS